MPALASRCLALPSALITAIAVMTGSVHAQTAGNSTVYRCGPGKYQSEPCPGGRLIESDGRSDEQRAQAEDTARRERALAESLRHERKHREREPIAQRAVPLGPTEADDAAKKDRHASTRPSHELLWPPRPKHRNPPRKALPKGAAASATTIIAR